MIKFNVITYRSEKDFKFGSWIYQHKSDGGGLISGRLKKNNSLSKYQLIYKEGKNVRK